jgi:hypothetical protein
VQYAEMCAHVEAGRIVAIAPMTDSDGDPSLVIVTGDLSPLHRMHLADAEPTQIARIAVRAVMQVRAHYGI